MVMNLLRWNVILFVGILSCYAQAQSPEAKPSQVVSGASSVKFIPVIIVNDDIITDYDIDQKVRIVSMSSREPVTKILQAAAVRQLIDERLKARAATLEGIKVTDEDLETAVQTIASKNNQDKNALVQDLAKNGIALQTLQDQLRTEILWNRLIQQKFGARVRPSEEDIRQEMDSLRQNNSVIYNLAQVLIPLKPNAPEPDTRKAFDQAKVVQGEIKNGCQDVERYKSTYARSGRLPNPMPARVLPPPIQDALANLEDNVASDPVRSDEGFHVIVVCSRQEDTSLNISEDQVRQKILSESFERFADSYLQNLRRDALVEQR